MTLACLWDALYRAISLKCSKNWILLVKSVTLKQGQYLLGLLVFACRIMPIGRFFFEAFIVGHTRGVLSRASCSPHQTIKRGFVSLGFSPKLQWSNCCPAERSNAEISLYTDVVGLRGFGAILGTQWCVGAWPESWAGTGWCRNLTLLEFFPFVMSVEIWGRQLCNCKLCFWTDNASVVSCINTLTSSSLLVLSLPGTWCCVAWSLIFGFWLGMCRGWIIKLLTRCHVFVGRSSGSCCRERPWRVSDAPHSCGT